MVFTSVDDKIYSLDTKLRHSHIYYAEHAMSLHVPFQDTHSFMELQGLFMSLLTSVLNHSHSIEFVPF